LVSDRTPLGNDLLDPILAEIARSGESPRDTASWITNLAQRSDEIREKALARLIERGILEAAPGGEVFLSAGVSRSRRYRTADGRTTEEVQLRIMRTLFSDDIPDPRDIVIISLASACGVFESILSPDELAQVRERIDLVCRLDLIGREVAAAIRQVETVPPLAPTSVRPAAEIPQAAGLPLLGNAFGMAGDLRRLSARGIPEARADIQSTGLALPLGRPGGSRSERLRGAEFSHPFPFVGAVSRIRLCVGAHRVLLSMDGPEHIRMRRLLVNGYSPKMLESHLDLAHDVTLRAIEEWSQGRPIEIQRAMQQIITEQIGMFCSGLSSEEYFDDLVYFLAMMIQMNITRRLPKVMERLPKYRRSRRWMEELYERIMESHRPEKREGQPPDFVDVLLEANQADPQFLPETDLFANVLAPYLVGMDTSASVCAFMLYALLKHPDIMERVREEVDEIYEHGPPTPEGLRKLDVTQRVAMETLRMYPVIPALTRTVSNSFEFEGYRVPARSEILLGTTVGHHLPEYFPEPHRFDIERYSPGRAEHQQPGAFAPFGVGRHRCIGSSLSELQIVLTLATVVREADLELERPERPLKIKLSPTAHPDASVRMRLVRRRGL